MRTIPRFALPYTPSDFMSALAAIAYGGPPPDAFGLLGTSPKFWTRSGRQALYLILRALRLPAGAGVAVPLFTDPSVILAISSAGHKPVFIDVEERYLTMDPRSLEEAKGTFAAVVPVHLFGQMADLPAVFKIADGLPVIEDTAHAPLSSLNGRAAGSWGVACLYSFASTKYWTAGGGGMAVINDAELANRVGALVSALPPPSRLQEFRNLLMQAAKAAVFTRSLYGTLGKPMRRWAEKWYLLEPFLDSHGIQRSHAAVASRQAARFPQRVEQQRRNSLQLLAKIGGVEDVVLPFERPGAHYNYHLFPVLLRTREERDAVAREMWKQRVDTSEIYFDVVKQCRRFGYVGGCPMSESIADRLLTLPNYASLSEADIDRVAGVFQESLQSCRATKPALLEDAFVGSQV